MTPAEDAAVRLLRGERIVVDAVLADLDGTLIDSIPAVEEAWRLWAAEFGVPTPQAHGIAAPDLVADAGVAPGARDHAVTRLSEIEARPGQRIATLPGAQSLIGALHPRRWAIVTSAAPDVAAARIAAAPLPRPEVIVTGGDVARTKPDPEPYLLARRRLGANGADDVVIAFEDTVTGLRSARAAGCIAVGVAGTERRDVLTGSADLVIGSFEDLVVTQGAEARILLGRTRCRPGRPRPAERPGSSGPRQPAGESPSGASPPGAPPPMPPEASS